MSSLQYIQAALVLLIGLSACKKVSPPTAEAPLVYTTVSTLAGNGITGFTNGSAATAQFKQVEALAIDAQGNVYAADAGNNCIRRITPTGTVSTFAGNGTRGLLNGPAATALFNSPTGIAFDAQGNLLVADTENNCIRKVTPDGTVSTLAGSGTKGLVNGAGSTARFNSPNGLAVDAQGNLYVAEYANYCIRKVLPNGTVSTAAGTGQRGYANGPAQNAQFGGPLGLTFDAKGTLYVADFGGFRVRKLSPDGTVGTVAGTGLSNYIDGDVATAQFSGPEGVTFDVQGNLFVADRNNSCIRKISPSGTVSRLAGTLAFGFVDGPVATAEFNSPTAIVTGAKGVLYLSEYGERIRKITAQ